jgi:uncharacterized protein
MDVTLVLTHDCNLGCGYCYAGRKFRKAMPAAVMRQALDLAFADGDAGKIQVSFFGGEPTLEWDLLIEAAEYARSLAGDRTLVQCVTTNGTLLTKERVDRLADLDVYVGLSIDGNQRAHEANRPSMSGQSTWAAVSKGLDMVVAAGRPFETISVVTPESVRELGASVAELFERGVPRVALNPCYESVWTDDDLAAWEQGLIAAAGVVATHMRAGRIVSLNVFDAKIIARIKGGLEQTDKCDLGGGFIAVAPSGNLYPCERLVGEDTDVAARIGHASSGVVRGRVADFRAENLPDWHAQNEECGGCGEQVRCSNHCACANRAETGSYGTAGGVQCWHEQTTARIADELADTLFAEGNAAFNQWFFPHGQVPVPVVNAVNNRVPRDKRALRILR